MAAMSRAQTAPEKEKTMGNDLKFLPWLLTQQLKAVEEYKKSRANCSKSNFHTWAKDTLEKKNQNKDKLNFKSIVSQ